MLFALFVIVVARNMVRQMQEHRGGFVVIARWHFLTKQLNIFLKWLFSKDIQKDMPGGGRTFRRKTSKFWDIWTLPPVVEEKHSVVFVDGIYLCRNACVLICCDRNHVLGWY